ncbi:MAG: hypothetical protein ACYDDZ_11030 [Acidimicrobiales bacterium]
MSNLPLHHVHVHVCADQPATRIELQCTSGDTVLATFTGDSHLLISVDDADGTVADPTGACIPTVQLDRLEAFRFARWLRWSLLPPAVRDGR